EDLEKIKKSKAKIKSSFVFGNEYYYQTKDFVSLSNRNFRKAINKFKKNYNFKIKEKYPKNKILSFLEKWKTTQKEQNILFDTSHESEIFCINKCDKIKGKWLFIEVDNKLAAYCLSYQLNEDFWVGIHAKADYKCKGISRFLLHRRASQFPNTKLFSLGCQARDKGIQEFKESLHPIKKINRHYIVTE
ncbi:MAG: phosphatidylglycerol lysyltransferase domain-containing protein, partial [archaeon]